MSTNASRYFFFGALVLLVIVAGYAVVMGAALAVFVLLAPLFVLFVLAYLAIRMWTRSRARP
jgi:hypothetical protein